MSELFDRWLAHREGYAAEADPPAASSLAPTDPSPEPAPPAAAVSSLPRTIFFKPRRQGRRILTAAFVLCLAALMLAGWHAWDRRTDLSYEFAGLALGLTAIAYAVRAGSAPAHLTVTGGTLEIRRGGARTSFELASPYTEIEVVGRPGSRRGKVLLRRGSLPPYVVDASMVDLAEFTKVLKYYRRDLSR